MFEENFSNLLDSTVESLKSYKELVEKYLPDDKKTKEQENLKELARKLCILDNEYKKSKLTLAKLEENLNGADKVDNIDDLYKQLLEDVTIDERPRKNHLWDKLFDNNEEVFEVQTTEEPLNNDQYDTINNSIQCSNVFTPPIDPISKQVIKEPVKNITCGHVYEKQFIFKHIQTMGRKAFCPYIGCNKNRLHEKSLKADDDLKNQIRSYLASQSSASEEDSF